MFEKFRPNSKRAPDTNIYVIGLRGLDGYCKVGISGDVKQRCSQISTSSPFKPYICNSYPIDRQRDATLLEALAHSALKPYRVNGEWFKIPPLVAWQVVKPIAQNREREVCSI